MAQSRSRQRGVASTTTSVLLMALGGFISVTGCSSDDNSVGSGGGERLGSVTQALICKIGGASVTCPADTQCVTYKCGLTGCEPTYGSNGNKCGAAPPFGFCADGVCCYGCVVTSKAGGTVCHPGTELDNCGDFNQECVDCDRGNTCEVYSCEPGGRCGASPVLDDKPCTDGSGKCWQGSCCSGCIDAQGVCVPGDSTNACGHTTATAPLVQCADCDDNNVCSGDPCINGVCAAKTPAPGACNDNNACTSGDMCSGTTCSGAGVNCNDNKVCTIDTCDAADGCVNTPVEAGTNCDDGNVCNGVSKCDGGTECNAGTALDCDDSNPCTTDSCDAVTGCKHVNNTIDCSDNNLCTLVDKCSGGMCVGTGAPNCDDNEPCTTDTCVPATQCKHAARPNGTSCDDENGCTPNSDCQAGKCQGIGGMSCDDMDPCTKPTCTAQSGCTQPDEDNGTPCTFDRCHVNSTCQAGACSAGELIDCDDSNVCTTDSCDPATGCKHVNLNVGDCSDDDLCTKSDKCTDGECVGAPVVCIAIDDCHVVGACDAATGICTDPRAADDTDCDDGIVPGPGECLDGICEPVSSGGAGGESGAGGAGTGGSIVGEGGEPTMLPVGGEGNEPGAGGMPGGPGTGGKSTGGSTSEEAGAPTDPDRVFVRQPGGCSCDVPGSSKTGSTGWLAGLAMLAGLARWGRGDRRRPRRAG